MKAFMSYLTKGRHYWVPALSLTAGIVLLLIGYFAIDAQTYPRAHGFTVAIGTVFGIGSVFGAVVKSFQFTGVFEQALSDVIYAERFVVLRKDLEDIWKRVFREVNRERFGNFSDEVHQTFMTEYFQTDSEKNKNHYYKSIVRSIDVSWKDESKGEVIYDGTTTVVIQPFVKGTDDVYTPVFRHSIKDGLEFDPTEWKLNNTELASRTSDGEITKNIDYTISTSDELDERGHYVTKVDIPLSGSEDYTIVRKSQMTIPLAKKPYVRIPNNTYVAKLQVFVDCTADGIRVNLETLGTTKGFKPIGGYVDLERKKLRQEYDGIMLPQQGFMIIFTKDT